MGNRNKTRVVKVDKYRGEAIIELSTEDLKLSVIALRIMCGSHNYAIRLEDKNSVIIFPYGEYQEAWFKHMKYRIHEI